MRWHAASTVLLSSLALAASVRADAARTDDLLDRLARIPGLTVQFEDVSPAPGFRYLHLSYTQPLDHDRPRRGTFEQQFALLHHDFDAPTVAYASGYDMDGVPFRAEPTALVDGNQIDIAQRFFPSSRPEPTNWRDLDIYQAAADQHRLIQALKTVYPGAWLSTGGSKGGMATVYHRRFFPDDVEGSIAYVAPNDVDNDVDQYEEFLSNVGPRQCREDFLALLRRALRQRDEIVPWIEDRAAEYGCPFEPGEADYAYEATVAGTYWSFWQYDNESSCPFIPTKTSSEYEVIEWLGVGYLTGVCQFEGETEGETSTPEYDDYFVAYYYQAGTELGWPDRFYPRELDDLLRYPETFTPRDAVPPEIPMSFDASAMPDIDRWVRREGSELLFVYGENDPWSAEPFELGRGTTDSFVYTVAGGSHLASIVELDDAAQLEAANTVRRWAGLPPFKADRKAPSSALSPVQDAAFSTPLDGLEPFFRRL